MSAKERRTKNGRDFAVQRRRCGNARLRRFMAVVVVVDVDVDGPDKRFLPQLSPPQRSDGVRCQAGLVCNFDAKINKWPSSSEVMFPQTE
jgi:hypothetical protein